jgi:acyl-CoA thioester hydrolase
MHALIIVHWTDGEDRLVCWSKRMPLSDFRCVSRFRVPFCDVDMLQHVNHAAYVVWAEAVRCIYFDEVLKEPLNGANGIILARLQFDYEQSLDYREDVAVACRISRTGRKSFDFLYEIWSDGRQLRAAHGLSTMVAYDYEAKKSIVIPERWREIVSAYEVVAPTVGS